MSESTRKFCYRSALLIFLFVPALTSLTARENSGVFDPRRKMMDLEKERYVRQQTYRRNRNAATNRRKFDVHFYRLNLEIRPQQKMIRGSLLLGARALVDSLQTLEIDLFSNMTVEAISQEGNPLEFRRSANLIEIDLTHPRSREEFFAIEIKYQGQPQRSGLGSFNWTEYQGKSRVWTLSEPYGAPSWWPCKDDPADKADSVFINITVPDELIAASNGLLSGTSSPSDSLRTFSWETRYPISPYLVVLAVGDYLEFSDRYVTAGGESMPIVFYAFPEHFNQAREDFSITGKMIAAFGSLFGEYPFIREKYGMASVPSGASMEHQTLTTLNSGLITGSHSGDWAIAHELAHHWFGDCITVKHWSDIWLHEGFASYSESLWEEAAHGSEAYHQHMDSQDIGAFEGSIFIEDTANVGVLFNRTVYNKGSWVLHMLRGLLGDSLFFEALRRFATRPDLVYGNATTGDFQAVCEEVAGRDLNWFFQQWIYRAGRPLYRYSWYSEGNEPPFTTTLAINQTNAQPGVNPLPYIMPLQIRLTGIQTDTTLTVWDSLASQEFRLVSDFRPLELQIDPDNWVLKKLLQLESREFAGIPTRFKLSQNYPNPFNANTVIKFGVASPGAVTIEIFNVLGQRVYRHQTSRLVTGFHEFTWDGRDSRGEDVPSGIYFYKFSDGRSFLVRKLVLIR